MKKQILDCMERIGLYVDRDKDDFDLNDYIDDSITFITFIVELESEFNIEFPDEYLIPSKFDRLSTLISVIKSLI